jgi:hypothetical protein
MTTTVTASKQPPADTGLIPTVGNPEVGYKVFHVLDDILKFKNEMGLPAKWQRNYELARNRHWKNRNVKAPLVTANLLYNHRQRTVNQLTDNSPTFNVKQVGEVEAEKEDVFEMLLHTAEHWWGDTEQQAELERSVLNGETYGCAIEKICFNPELENGIGEVDTVIVDPYHFGWYPVKAMDPQRAEAVLHFYPQSVRTLRREYPDKAQAIKSDDEYLKSLGDERLEMIGTAAKRPSGYLSTFAGIVKNLLNLTAEGQGVDAETLVVECWVRDHTQRPDGAGDLYPGKIRMVKCCSGGSVVLEDRSNPSINPDLEPEQASLTYLYSRFPFVFVHSVTDTSFPWGMSDYEQLEELNVEVNKTLSQLTMIKDRLSRIKLLNPSDSGVSNDELTNKPGILNPTSAMTSQGIRYLDPPQLPPDLPNLLTIYRDLFYAVAGSFELEQAQRDGRDVIAYKAIAALLERAATMLRGKIRNYTRLIRERGRMYLSCAMNWYTEPRWISYEQDGDELTAAIQGAEMMIPAKLSVVSGSTMPVSKVQEREEALALYDKGAIDSEELLKKIEWRDWKKVTERMRLGTLGVFLQRLGVMGFPPALLQALEEIGAMEERDFERAIEAGEIPPLAALLPGPEDIDAAEPEMPPDMAAELDKAAAEVQKLQAETRLVEEKIVTEKVDQQVKLAGVQFDEDKLKIERARTISDIENAARGQEREDVSTVQSVGKAEREEARAERGEQREDKRLAAEIETKEAEQRAQGPHRERGLKSNNQQT